MSDHIVKHIIYVAMTILLLSSSILLFYADHHLGGAILLIIGFVCWFLAEIEVDAIIEKRRKL